MDLELLDLSQLRQRRGEKWRRYPEDVLPAWVADMDFGLAAPLRECLRRAVELSDVGYPQYASDHGVQAVLAARMQRLYGWRIEAERVEVLSDVVQGLYLGLIAFSGPGDGVITPLPVYPPFLSAVGELGRKRVPLHLVPGKDRFELDFDRLEAALDPSPKVLMLCHPHNPTGRVLERSELERLAELTLRHGWVVLSDEIHADLCYTPHTHVPFACLSPEVEARTITLTSASKAFNLAGLRCAVAVFGSAELQRDFQAQIGRHTRGGLGILGLETTRVAWTECDAWLAELRSYLRGNRDAVADFLASRWPDVSHHPPEATYLAWLDCRELDLPEGAYRFFLRRAKVALSPGEAYGAEGTGYVRLNFATSRRVLHEILERMDSALERL